MKHWTPALAILAVLYALLAVADDFKTVNGKEYKNAKVSRVEPDGIMIKFHGGIAKIFFVELPPEIQKQYGYDPVAATQQRARPADLMSQAESALRAGQFGKGAELLNQIVSGYPSSPQALTVHQLCSLVRDKQPTQDGPLTEGEAQRLRSLMDALANIEGLSHSDTRKPARIRDGLRSRNVPRHRQRLGSAFVVISESSRLDGQSARRRVNHLKF